MEADFFISNGLASCLTKKPLALGLFTIILIPVVSRFPSHFCYNADNAEFLLRENQKKFMLMRRRVRMWRRKQGHTDREKINGSALAMCQSAL